jgi:hypothetical protein
VAVVVSDLNGINRYLMTCSHVALGGKADDLKGSLTNPLPVALYEYGNKAGNAEVVFAQLNRNVDLALVKVAPPLANRFNRIPNAGALKNPIERSTLQVNQKIGFYSRLQRRIVWGKVKEPLTVREITLKYGTAYRNFTGLITLSNISGTAYLSQPGESGSVLFTEDLSPVGLLIGAGGVEDYAISITEALRLTKTKFLLTP